MNNNLLYDTTGLTIAGGQCRKVIGFYTEIHTIHFIFLKVSFSVKP